MRRWGAESRRAATSSDLDIARSLTRTTLTGLSATSRRDGARATEQEKRAVQPCNNSTQSTVTVERSRCSRSSACR